MLSLSFVNETCVSICTYFVWFELISLSENMSIKQERVLMFPSGPDISFFYSKSCCFTALFTNMRILKFKSQLTIAFFIAVSHLKEPLRKQNFTLTGSKGHGLWCVIGGFRSLLCVSVFQGSLLVIVIMIDGSEKRDCEGGFWTLEFACLWKAQ